MKEWAVVQDGPASGLSYPSSSKKHINWDKVEVEEDKLEGDAALNSVFQVRKFMMRSHPFPRISTRTQMMTNAER